MTLNVIFGFQSELNIIRYTISKTDRYIKTGYKYSLPKKVNEFSSLTDITSSLKEEYAESDYEKARETLTNEYSKIESKFIEMLTKTFGDKIPHDFDVIITKYGVFGSYNPPNKIVLNINNTYCSLLNTLVHEICHLMIEPFVIMYNINQALKERIVDLILGSNEFNFLGFSKIQDVFANKKIDDLFNSYFFKSKDDFFKNLNKIK